MNNGAIRLIKDIHDEARLTSRPVISFEFFPPKTPQGCENFFNSTLPALCAAKPDFCSVTYGAGGGTREATLGIVERIQTEFVLTTLMHLTCVNATKEELRSVIAEAGTRGVRNLLALRGDPPAGTGDFVAADGGFAFSRQLVEFIREIDGFDIGTAGFPEGHIACQAGKQTDWGYLAEKIRAGANFVITQLFFDNADYFEFRDYLTKKLGVDVPLIPGLMPIVSRNQTKRFVSMCGAKLPVPFLERLEELGDDDDAVVEFGIEYCARQCEELLQAGAPGVHFYTLNKSHSTLEVLKRLGR
jgi:methylenetetrahydrofolate reductase (NADPH)